MLQLLIYFMERFKISSECLFFFQTPSCVERKSTWLSYDDLQNLHDMMSHENSLKWVAIQQACIQCSQFHEVCDVIQCKNAPVCCTSPPPHYIHVKLNSYSNARHFFNASSELQSVPFWLHAIALLSVKLSLSLTFFTSWSSISFGEAVWYLWVRYSWSQIWKCT